MDTFEDGGIMIELFLKFDISFFSVLMLLLILGTMGQRKDTMSYSSRLFRRLIFVNIFMLMLEIVSWKFDMKPGRFNWYANYISNMLFAWSTPMITCVWASYIDYRIFGSAERLRSRWFYIQPLLANTVLIIINLMVPIIFSVSQTNVYAREPFMWLIVLINSIALLYLCYLAYKNRATIQKEVVFMILLFVLLPAITAGLQVMIYGVFILWPMMAVIIVVTYIFLETTSTSNDYLTGLFSRVRVDEYIDYLLSTNQQFGVIMFDLNDFKQINDTYGHHQGDAALIVFSKALSRVFANEKMVARYAGDEFVVVSNIIDEVQLKMYREQLEEVLDHELRTWKESVEITFSLGYHDCNMTENPSYKILLNEADKKMYIDKRKMKID